MRYVGFVVTAAVVAGCGSASATGTSHGRPGNTYPLYSEPGPVSMHAVTGPDGSVSYRPPLPTVYETRPTPTCQRATVEDGAGSTRSVAIPPTPGLRAQALDDHRTRVRWWFRDVPDDCRPTLMLISVSANDDPRATPMTVRLPFAGRSGSTVIDYGSFGDPPNVALASAELGNGLRSGVASVLIRRT